MYIQYVNIVIDVSMTTGRTLNSATKSSELKIEGQMSLIRKVLTEKYFLIRIFSELTVREIIPIWLILCRKFFNLFTTISQLHRVTYILADYEPFVNICLAVSLLVLKIF